MPFGPLLSQPTPKLGDLLSQPLDPIVVVLLDGTAKCDLSLFEEELHQRRVNVGHKHRMPPEVPFGASMMQW